MSKLIDDKIKKEFLYKLYFELNEGFGIAGIRRAYLDFSRTLTIKKQKKQTTKEAIEYRNKKREETEKFLLKILENNFVLANINSQEEFDKVHKNFTNKLIEFWNELSYGQAQKWINMSLKYWLLFGSSKIKYIEKNACYFHIPIDRQILQKIFNEKYPIAWSKINNYETYMKYQLNFRNKYKCSCPILKEFELYNAI